MYTPIPLSQPLTTPIRMPHWHIFPLSLILALAFTYTGVEVSLWVALSHPDFLVNLFLNMLEIYGIVHFTYRQYYRQNRSFRQVIWRSLLLLYLIEFLRIPIFEYEPEDFTELWSIVIPFGTILVFTFNYFYHLLKQMEQTHVKLPSSPVRSFSFWLETLNGKVQLDPSTILYADLCPSYVKLVTFEESYKSFTSLKRIEEEISPHVPIFRLNKQTLCHAQAIQSFRSLKDGRLEVSLPTGETRLVSKNKASSFKRWLTARSS